MTSAQLPEPGRFWIRYLPHSWEGPDRPWLHLATGRLGEPAKAGTMDLSGLAEKPLDDVLYLPPVPPGLAAARDELARRRLERGGPVVVQLLAGEATAADAADAAKGAAVVTDLLEPLLAGDLAPLSRCPEGSCAAWPLLAGLTDAPSLWDAGCRLLAAAGVVAAPAVALQLGAGDRRRLARVAGKEEEAFDALFHREPPDERAFAVVAHRHGLAPFLARPLPRTPALVAANLRLGGVLALTAELWLRLGRSVETGQALFRDARWLDRTGYDVAGLEREGNLGVLPLDPLSRTVVAEQARTGRAQLVDELLTEYLQPASAVRETLLAAARET